MSRFCSSKNFINMIRHIGHAGSKCIIFFHPTSTTAIIICSWTLAVTFFFISLLRFIRFKNMNVWRFHGICNNNFRIQIVIISYHGNFIIIIKSNSVRSLRKEHNFSTSSNWCKLHKFIIISPRIFCIYKNICGIINL